MASAGVCLAACRRVLADDYPDSRRAAQQDFDRLNPDFGVPADQHNSYGRQVILWVPGIRPPQAAWEYSWISPTEPISTYDPPSRHHDRWLARPEQRRLPQGAVRTVHIVVVDVLGQHRP